MSTWLGQHLKHTQSACPRLQAPGAQLTWWDDGAFTGFPCFPLSVITPPEWVLAVLWPDVTANEIPGVADIVCWLFTIPQVQLAPYRFRSLAHISCLITKVLPIVHAIKNPALIWVYLYPASYTVIALLSGRPTLYMVLIRRALVISLSLQGSSLAGFEPNTSW